MTFYTDDHITVHHGDCREVMAELPASSVDAVVTDPPYGLEFMGRAWDRLAPVDRRRATGQRRDHGTDRAGGYERAGVRYVVDGHDAQAWHSEWASAALQVAKPGAHLIAFGGTRTFHRLTSAVEDAGWQVRDCLSWLYGSGFPKSHNLDGDRAGWGTALKPAWEPIVLARKPLDGTVAANVTAHGPGALNINGCRIGFRDEADERESKDKNRHADFGSEQGGNAVYGDYSMVERRNYDPEGRWPANTVLDEAAAALLDDETAGASRFFYCAKAPSSEKPWQAGRQVGKERCSTCGGWEYGNPSCDCHEPRWERNDSDEVHPTVKPLALMRWLVRLVAPPGGLVLDPFAGTGTTGEAALIEGFRSVLIEQHRPYCDLIVQRLSKPIQPTLGGVA